MLKTVRSRLFASYVVVIVFTLGAIGLLLSIVLIPRVQNQLVYGSLQLAFPTAALHLRAEMLRALRDLGRDQVLSALQQSVVEMGGQRDVRVLVLTGRYLVLADSEGTLEGHSFARVDPSPDRRQGPLSQGRYRTPDGQELLWVGGPLDVLGREESKVRQQQRFVLVLAQSPKGPSALSRLLRNQFFLGGLASLGLALLLAYLVARSIARPLQRVAAAAKEVARGNYDLHLDITSPDEVRSVAASFNAMTRAVKASQQAQRDFVANVSHELKTPLTSVQGFSQAILDGTASDSESVQQAAGVIHDEAGRMGRMVEQLLDLAKIEAGQIVMTREPIDLKAVLESCVGKLTPQAVRGDVSLDADLSQLSSGLRIIGDGDRLAQVFIILLDNALEHTPSGGRVTVAADTPDVSQVTVSVSDTGAGIPAEDLPRIFERFYQVDKSRVRGKSGAGLGLSIAKEIVTIHGGKIAVESIVGVGSKFTVRLPSAQPLD